MLKKLVSVMLIATIALLVGCTTINTTATPKLSSGPWLVAPFVNNSNTPRAGYSAMVMTGDLLRAKGYQTVNFYIPRQSGQGLIPQETNAQTMQQILSYARRHGYAYIMSGTVNEWRYKAGLDGEPAVSVTLDLVDVQTGHSVWNSVASGSGWGRDSITRIAQELINRSINTLPYGRKLSS